MAEYAGYVASTPIDYGAISSGLMANRLAVEKLKKTEASDALKLLQKQQAADEKARIQARKEEGEEDKILREDLDRVKAAENIPEKSFNTFATEGLGNIKSKIFELNKLKKEGKITNQDYIINVNNLQDQWNQFTTGVKSFKTNLGELSKSVQEGKASKIGAGLVGMYANTGQLSNKVLGVKDDKGISRLQQYTLDNDGNRIEDETITNIGTLANASLFFDGNVDYNKRFEEANKAIGQVKIEKGLTTIESQKQNEKYNTVLQQQIQGILSDDMDKARLLTENLGYEFYFTKQQKDDLLKKGVDEKKMVEFKLNNKGAYSPTITDDQNKAAVTFVTDAIEGSLDYSLTKEKATSIRVNTGPKDTQSDKDLKSTFRTAERAYKGLTGGNSSKVIKDLTDLWKQRYEEGAVAKPIYKNGKIVGAAIYTLNEQKQPEREVDRASSIKDFFRLYTPKSRQGQEYVDFERAVELLGLNLNDL